MVSDCWSLRDFVRHGFLTFLLSTQLLLSSLLLKGEVRDNDC